MFSARKASRMVFTCGSSHIWREPRNPTLDAVGMASRKTSRRLPQISSPASTLRAAALVAPEVAKGVC
jgi:hypothetical protein